MKVPGQFLLFHALICAASHVQGIINGELAPEGSMQFMVSVQNKNGHVCGGFLISEDFVVTAALCDIGLTHVLLGGHNRKNSNVKKIEISNQCKHKDYSDAQYGYDIMLLKLAEKAPMGRNIKTIPLAENDMNLSVNQECSVAGWGKTVSTGGLADDLRVVNVSIIDHNDCQQSWGGLPHNVICAGGKYTDKGFCQGDSGGPLVCNGKAVGIVSFNKDNNCLYPDVPNVYTDIREYVDWIEYITIVNLCPIDQRPRTKDQGRRTEDQGARTSDQRPKTKDQQPKTNDQRPRTKYEQPTTKDLRQRTKDQGPRSNNQRPTTNDQGPTTKDQVRTTNNQGPYNKGKKTKDQEPRTQDPGPRTKDRRPTTNDQQPTYNVRSLEPSTTVQRMISNGELAPEGSMQFMVSVQNKNGHVCVGFLISEDFVVTAAHCDNGLKHVILGGHNLKNSNVKKIEISNQYKHKKYSDVGFGYDIMLLKLANKAPKGRNIKTIPMAEKNMNLSVNQECSVAGWGKTESTSGLVGDLRVANVSIIDHNDCQQSWGGLPPNVICAGGKYTDKGFCQGDGGGPLVCNGKAVGIVAFNRNSNCKYPDVPNVYTDIREYVDWIKYITMNKMCSHVNL